MSTGVLQYDRNMTPLSLHDSGVEEQEDAAMVPAETLCELLRRAYRLTQEKFNHYEEFIASQLERKSPQKVKKYYVIFYKQNYLQNTGRYLHIKISILIYMKEGVLG